MVEFKQIFTPIRIGKITVKNRIEAAPANPFLALMEGGISRELIEWEKAFARGGAGIVTIGDTPIIYNYPPRVGHGLNLGTDKCINGLERLAEAIHRYGAKASIELSHHVQDSPMDLTLEQIKMLIQSYAEAAYRCMVAGMDMIMIHGAHGHLPSQFFSPKRNFRTDAYGGTMKNRARFILEILEAIRKKVGDNLAIEYRISADELVPDGLHVEEQLEFAKLIQDKIDLLHVSAGKLYEDETLPMMIQPTYIPRGVNVHFAELFKKELDIPVATVGSIDLEMAEKIVAENKADIVAMVRTFLADPDCVKKAKNQEARLIRPCVRCNTCIDRTHAFHLAVRCAVNPLNGREAEFVNLPLPEKKKKVVVVGGGPAGMEAARTAAGRGHEVVLFEKNDKLGGNLILAAAPPFKEDMRKYLEWSRYTIMNAPNITVRLSTEANPEVIKAENPDSLIIAIGAIPIIPDLPGVERENVVWVGDVYLNKVEVGDSAVIVGAGLTGSEAALFLAQQGKRVTLIDMLSLEEIDALSPFINVLALRNLLSQNKVSTITNVKLEAITAKGIIVIDRNWNKTEIFCDTVVLSLGFKPLPEITEIYKDLAPEVYLIGDCNNWSGKGNLFGATREGFDAAIEI